MIYDEELMIKDVEALFKSNLNDEIAAINIEKGAFIGDALFLEDIPTEKYIFESLDSRILNYKGYFVMYGIVDTPIRDIQEDNFVEDLTMTFQVATFDKGEADRKNTFYKLLRYRRAIKTVLKKNPDVFRNYAKPQMASLKPDAFPYSNKRVILTIGIDIKASVTSN